MVFTSRIEVLGVKPDFHVSCIMNSFHNDLFSQGTCIFGGNILVFAEEPGIQVPKRPPKATQKAPKVNLGVPRSKEAPKVGSRRCSSCFGVPLYTQKALKYAACRQNRASGKLS